MGPLFQPSQEGPRKLKPRPGGLTEACSQDFHFTLENRCIVGGLGVSRDGKEDSCSTLNKKKGQSELEACKGAGAPSPHEVTHLSLRNQVTCLVWERSKPTTSMPIPTSTAAHTVPQPGGRPVPSSGPSSGFPGLLLGSHSCLWDGLDAILSGVAGGPRKTESS